MCENISDDVLLRQIVAKGKETRQAQSSIERDPQRAWMDGWVEAWNVLLFHRPPGQSIEQLLLLCQGETPHEEGNHAPVSALGVASPPLV